MARNSRGASKKGKKKGKRPARDSTSAADVDMGGASASLPGSSRPAVWRPGVDSLEDGEELQFDPSAYDCLHSFRLAWPCLSFDVVRDSLGEDRKAFPHTLFMVAGTQASSSPSNSISAVRLTNLRQLKHRKQRGGEEGEGEEEEEEEESDSDSESESEEEEGEEGLKVGKPGDPVMKVRSISHHHGCVNRIRCMPQQPHIAATWSEAGSVQVWDLTPQVRSLSDAAAPSAASVARQAPLQLYSSPHGGEGFAMDWSPAKVARMATGDCLGGIAQWEPAEGGKWAVNTVKFTGHQGSVEDIQWSPGESDVFASAGCDGCVCFWDVRSANRSAPAMRVKAHAADVNVIAWNRLASCMVASGCDDGSFRIWDLRLLRDGGEGGGGKGGEGEDGCASSFIAHFNHHHQPITSIEWSPYESSTLATACADNQVTIWDLSLERDAEEEASFESDLKEKQAEAPTDLPPQLMFVHQGQSDIKEVHWHAHIPGLLLSTAADGFNVFKPANL